MSGYGYGRVPAGPGLPAGTHVLKRDGAEVARGTEQQVWKHLHDNTSCSVDWALKHEGYSIEVAEVAP